MAGEAKTEEEDKMLKALNLLGIDEPAKIKDLFTALGGAAAVKKEPVGPSTHGTFHFPKFSTFYGESRKDEASWSTFSYEVEALVANKSFTEDQILLGVRRALKGHAADKLRILGPEATLKEVMEKLDGDYGAVESRESIMKQFYSCSQKQDESIEAYSSRLEDFFDKAVKLDALKRTDTALLKELFHAGLKKDLKIMSLFQKTSIPRYEDFKKEIRKLEADLKPDEVDAKKPCKAAVHTEKKAEASPEWSEMKEILQQINKRIDHLEEKKEHHDNSDWYRPSFRDRGRGQGYQQQAQQYKGRGFRGQHRGRGRGDHRPLGRNTFQPTCLLCEEKGHIQTSCPQITKLLVCTHCKTKGHVSRECPN